MRVAVVVVGVAACGRIGFETGTGELTTYPEAVIADGAIAYWRFGDSGDQLIDELGGAPGSYAAACERGEPGALRDDADPAVRFVDGCSATLDDRFGFEGTAAFSIEVWVAADDQEFGHVFTKQTRGGGNQPDDGYAFLVTPDGAKAERAVGGSIVETDEMPMSPAGFTYLVGVYDGSALRLYADAVQIGVAAADARLLPDTPVAAIIGRTTGGNQFVGVLDELALYARVLDATQIQRHHALGRDGPMP
jgi:hypothetical protein